MQTERQEIMLYIYDHLYPLATVSLEREGFECPIV